jgi:nucleotide-binding universal stress UspA family protein
MNVKKILFATDFSDSSDAALSYASSIAAESGAQLYIVHVGYESPAYLAEYGGFGTGPDMTEKVARENRVLLNQLRPTVPNVNYQHHYLSGPPEHEILDFAEREHVDLIVIGSHGRTGISRLLMGSVAEAVVRRAKCPVLTVKQPIGDRLGSDDDREHEHEQHAEPIAGHSVD